MSRPPYPHAAASTGGEQTGDLRRLDYLALEFADLVGLQEELAVTRLGRPRRQLRGDEADVALTFMELSALVAHVLGAYQRHYAGEAYISAAQAASSLVRHARRLAYDPDSGLAASGHVVLVAKDGVSGIVEAGQPLASVPLGQIKAQDYETGGDVAVDAALNELEPLGARKPIVVEVGASEIRLQGVGHGLQAGDRVALLSEATWDGFVLRGVTEDAVDDMTTVTLDGGVGGRLQPATKPALLLAHPALELRQFGADADPVLFPPSAVRDAKGAETAAVVAATAPGAGGAKAPQTTAPSTPPTWAYAVQRPDGHVYDPLDIYLSEQVADPLLGRHVLRTTGATHQVFEVTAEIVAAVSLLREAVERFQTHTVTVKKVGESFESSLSPDPVEQTQTISSRIGGTVTAVRVADRLGNAVARSSLSLPSLWLTGWAMQVPLAATEPDPVAVGDSLRLPGLHPALTPGRPLALADREGTVAQIVTVRSAELDVEQDLTTIVWDRVGDPPAGGWKLHDLKVFGNVAQRLARPHRPRDCSGARTA